MQTYAVTFAVGKQGDGANIIRQRKWAKHARSARRGDAIQCGGKVVGVQINNSALRRWRDTIKFS